MGWRRHSDQPLARQLAGTARHDEAADPAKARATCQVRPASASRLARSGRLQIDLPCEGWPGCGRRSPSLSMISNACSADLPTAPVLEGQDPATRFAESRHPANRAHLEGLLAVGAGGDGCSCLVHLGGHLLPHYLRMRRAMLSACSESCSRFLTSLATEWRDRFGWSFQMASAWLCHRCHCAALVAGPDVGLKLRARFSVVGWSCPSM